MKPDFEKGSSRVWYPAQEEEISFEAEEVFEDIDELEEIDEFETEEVFELEEEPQSERPRNPFSYWF
jgi:hypothetical protein